MRVKLSMVFAIAPAYPRWALRFDRLVIGWEFRAECPAVRLVLNGE